MKNLEELSKSQLSLMLDIVKDVSKDRVEAIDKQEIGEYLRTIHKAYEKCQMFFKERNLYIYANGSFFRIYEMKNREELDKTAKKILEIYTNGAGKIEKFIPSQLNWRKHLKELYEESKEIIEEREKKNLINDIREIQGGWEITEEEIKEKHREFLEKKEQYLMSKQEQPKAIS
jgi:hypothetical protein